ncbi:flavanone 3-dioxygenase 2-like [Zingiber officinale]|uniref:flavanone 3-dioxygenase 2-like n=1 Tax=Zingiber officinale TaxID=94328 RepID=UPI001C4B68FD|nr:flavanone 3-dioxygenase 2-like [Zingiber officinale]
MSTQHQQVSPSNVYSNVTDHASLPSSYVRPESQRPCLEEVITNANIPTIDLTSFDVVAQVAHACSSHGFFQVVNHGVEVELIRKMMEVVLEFFRLLAEEKAKHYFDDPAKNQFRTVSFFMLKLVYSHI